MPAEGTLKKFTQPPAPAGGFVLQAIIFANGDFVPPADLAERLASADLVIAADGGSQHCRALNLRPRVVIGDLDSLDPQLLKDWETNGVRIISYPVDKDQTDLQLALLYAKDSGAKQVTVLGGLGKRWDHSIANLLLLANPQFNGMEIVFIHGDQDLFVIQGKPRLVAKAGDRVSLLPLSGDVKGITTAGLKYPLNSESLLFGSSRGVSNVVINDDPQIEVQDGILLCVISSPS
jgi:thiamine pyrophosphokinase